MPDTQTDVLVESQTVPSGNKVEAKDLGSRPLPESHVATQDPASKQNLIWVLLFGSGFGS